MDREVQIAPDKADHAERPRGSAQAVWAARDLPTRLRILRSTRHLLAQETDRLIDAIPADLLRTRADTMAAEILPLLAACKFLEREAPHILAPRRLGRSGRPFWLASVDATVERVAYGTILIIAPANYPLFLPGVQALQALAAGNAVVWKPGTGGAAVARLFASICGKAELPSDLLRVTEESVEAATAEIKRGPDKIIFTGSVPAGRTVQHLAAEASIPVVTELSGCDAVFALPSADRERLVDALCFGMRLNGSATCMAPRRLLLIGRGHDVLVQRVRDRFAAMNAVFIGQALQIKIEGLLEDARQRGARLCGEVGDVSMKPVLVLNGSPQMAIAKADLFAPLLTVLACDDQEQAIEVDQRCELSLTAAVFGEENAARAFAGRLTARTVLINDIIVPTADPRVSFGGRGASGFGSTRGREGLLEMTAVKTISVRRGSDRRHYHTTGAAHEELFGGVIAMSHAAGWRARLAGLRRMLTAAAKLR